MDKEYMRQYKRTQRKSAKENGICIHCCKREATPGFTSCEICREAIRIRMAGHNYRWKPEKPAVCPLCNNPKHNILYWHHWDDSHPSVGIWLCPHCNAMVELEDRRLVEKYRALKIDAIADLT